MSLLEVDSIQFSYGTRRILADVYLKVKTGEVVGFLGRNGCGKSTLLKIIFGVLKGESQSVRIDGVYLSEGFKSGKIKLLTQDHMIPSYLKLKQAAKLFESDIHAIEKHPEWGEYRDFSFGELSTGIRKFMETLIILHTQCAFILLDEPFSYLAPALTERLIPEIKLASQSKGILLTDHQYSSILTVSDRLYYMHDQGLFPIQSEKDLEAYGYIYAAKTH